MRTVSIGTMIEQLHGLLGTGDLSDWEDGFVTSVHQKYEWWNKNTQHFSGKQVETIEKIWAKHFA